MRRQHVDIIRRVDHFGLPINKVDRLNMVSTRPFRGRAFNLHPPQPPPRIQDEVIAIENLVAHFEANEHQFDLISRQLLDLFTNENALSQHVHSMKSRVKDPDHLAAKLLRKMAEAEEEGKEFSIRKENLFYKINDLAGVRIIHLYTRQVDAINKALLSLFEEEKRRANRPNLG